MVAAEVWQRTLNAYGRGGGDSATTKRRRRRRSTKEKDKDKEETTDIKSNNPHLTGGEKTFEKDEIYIHASLPQNNKSIYIYKLLHI